MVSVKPVPSISFPSLLRTGAHGRTMLLQVAATIRTTADQDSAVAGELAVGEVIAVTDKVPATFGEVVTHSIKFDRGWADVRPFPPLASPPVPHLSWVYPDQFFLWQLVSQTGQPLLEELVLVGLTPLNPIRSASSGYI